MLGPVLLALAPSAAHAQDPPRWQAHFRPAATWEYPTTAGLLGLSFSARFVVPHGDANWRSVPSFDRTLRDAIAISPGTTQDGVELATDLFFFGGMAYRLVDSVLLPGLVHGDWYLAQQMSMVDLEAFAVVAGVLWGSQLVVRRQRSYRRHCDDPQQAQGWTCEPDDSERNRSFIAGHFAVTLTTAGLTCMHHRRMPLYGGGPIEDWVCGGWIAAAALTGYGRLMLEEHYASDLLLGVLLGGIGGWLVPSLMHYGFGDPGGRGSEPGEVVVVPMVSDGGIGLSAAGIFD